MNGDIAHAVATTAEQYKRQQENIALNEFDAALHQARVEARASWDRLKVPSPRAIQAISRLRRSKVQIAVCHVAAAFARIEGPR